MSKPAGSARVNLTVPRALKARMDEVTDSVNWSAIAAKAFEATLTELDARREVGSMDDVFARLEASEQVDAAEMKEAGKRAGREWASKRAKAKDLRNLDGLSRVMENPDWWRGFHHAGEGVAQTLDNDGLSIEEFWNWALDGDSDDWQDDEFVGAFIEGAAEVWEEFQKHKAAKRSKG